MITIKIDRLDIPDQEILRDFLDIALSYNYNLESFNVEITFGRLEESIAFLTAIDNARFARS